MMMSASKGRVGIGALAVGIMQAALEAGIEQAKMRKQFGQPDRRVSGHQFILADMAKDTEAAPARSSAYRK